MFKGFLDDFFDILFNYRKGLQRIAAEKNIWHGLVVYLLVSILVVVATTRIGYDSYLEKDLITGATAYLVPFLSNELIEGLMRLLPLVTVLMQIAFLPLFFFLSVAILSLVVQLYGGREAGHSLGAVLGYAQLPYIAVALGGLFSRYTAFNVSALVTLLAFSWSLWLKIYGIKTVYKFSAGRSLLVYFTPFLAISGAFVLFALLFVVFLFPLAAQVLENLPSGILQ